MNNLLNKIKHHACPSKSFVDVLIENKLPKFLIVPNRTKYYNNRHYDQKYGVWKVELPDFDKMRNYQKNIRFEEVLSKLKEKGIVPPQNRSEKKMFTPCLMTALDSSQPKEGDGKFSSIADKPVKFTTSEAYVGYKASRNFYGDDRELPESHNLVIAGTGIFAFFYLIFLRDEQDEGGALSLLRPVHETVPELAIPLLQATIAENRKCGQNTSKLEKKLAEYLKEPDKHGGGKPKLVEN